MEESKKAELLKGMFAGASFSQSVVVGIAEAGSTVCYQDKAEETRQEKEMPSPEKIAKAMMKVQDLFWGNSSYAIPFCVFRDCYHYHGNRTQYEREVALLPFTVMPQWNCTPGVVSSTINDNKYMELPIDKWKDNRAPERVLKLVEGFQKALDEMEERK